MPLVKSIRSGIIFEWWGPFNTVSFDAFKKEWEQSQSVLVPQNYLPSGLGLK